MDHLTRMGGSFTTESTGLGDIRLSGLYKVLDASRQRMHVNLGLSIPTGSIDQEDVTPASAPDETQLPYPMQIGSGTFDLRPGLTYLLQGDRLSFGAQGVATLRLGENEREYNFGNQVRVLTWGGYRFSDWVSAALRFTADFAAEIEENDPTYNRAVANNMVPTVVPGNFGGTQLFSGIGLNFFVPQGALSDVRIALEYELPLYRDINGPQLETDAIITAGIQYSF